jgi:hypothetical protein
MLGDGDATADSFMINARYTVFISLEDGRLRPFQRAQHARAQISDWLNAAQ